MSGRRSAASLIASLALCLSACGFTPMYGAGSAARGLEDIRIETGDERVDFLLQESLLDAIGSRSGNGRYVLRTETELNVLVLGIGAEAIARRYAIQLNVTYELLDNIEGAQTHTGQVSVEAAYDASSAAYASQSARLDAEARAAEQAADRISMQLARAAGNGELW